MMGGIQYEVSTKRSTEAEAYAQLAIFEKNPTASRRATLRSPPT
jgi:hypothetical protein